MRGLFLHDLERDARPNLMLQSVLWMLQTTFLSALCLLLQPEPQAQASQATGGLPGRVRNLPGPRPPVDQALRPRDRGAKRTSEEKIQDYDVCLTKYENKVVSIMAAQAAKDRCAIETAPSTKYLRLANQMLFIIESHDIGNEVQKKMTTLAPEYEGGTWVTRGRLKKGLPKILGVEKLPILLSSSRLV